MSTPSNGSSAGSSLSPGTGPVDLPRAPEPPLLLEASLDWEPDGSIAQPLRVLIADDDGDFATGLARLVSLEGHRTQIAGDGFGTLELAESFRPHLIFMDIDMPGENGHAVCRRIRNTWWGAGIAIAAVTGMGEETFRRCRQNAGFDFRLAKPVEWSSLETLLRRFKA
jgi:two-component system CheB/CheR fusion protein